MLLDSDKARLRHMIDAAEQAIEYSNCRVRADVENSPPLQHLFIRNIEILGEAAARISAQMQERHPEVPWGDIIGMRNRLVHKYFDVDLDIVWSTVQQDLPRLLPSLRSMLDAETKE